MKKPTEKQLKALKETGKPYRKGEERARINGAKGNIVQKQKAAARKQFISDFIKMLNTKAPLVFRSKLQSYFPEYAEQNLTVRAQVCAAIATKMMNADKDMIKLLFEFLSLINPQESNVNINMPPAAPQIIFDIPKPDDVPDQVPEA